MKLKTFLLAGGLSLGGLFAAVAPASAYVACNPDGDCWHTDRRVVVPGVTFTYHPDDWYFHRHWDADRTSLARISRRPWLLARRRLGHALIHVKSRI